MKEVTFNYIYDKLIGTWTEQLNTLVIQLFDVSVDHIRQLDSLMGDGQMVPVSCEGQEMPPGTSSTNHTAAFLNEQAGKRAFYAAAIPSVWKMRKPYAQYPVILDFGSDCNRDISMVEKTSSRAGSISAIIIIFLPLSMIATTTDQIAHQNIMTGVTTLNHIGSHFSPCLVSLPSGRKTRNTVMQQRRTLSLGMKSLLRSISMREKANHLLVPLLLGYVLGNPIR